MEAGLEFGEDGGLYKRAAVTDCDQEGETIEVHHDITALGGVGTVVDTTRMYTQAGTLVCGFDDEVAYDLSRGYYKNGLYESWFQTRTDYPDFMAVFAGGTGTMKMTVGLGGGRYEAPLTLAPGIDLMSEEEPGPAQVYMSGPIQLSGSTVGWFELMGDDRVVIRDADRKIVETH